MDRPKFYGARDILRFSPRGLVRAGAGCHDAVPIEFRGGAQDPGGTVPTESRFLGPIGVRGGLTAGLPRDSPAAPRNSSGPPRDSPNPPPLLVALQARPRTLLAEVP